ncbi:MAG: substrate-binding domain-containing protein [Deltaproteobacteria bacterium]|nr:substrate-binding domain-containing protein [Deltaproteobacteria bacterium]MCB9489616.1 substrate-binding domain-containing protein [Deltaproteobacteria bacterium]
MFSLRRHRGWNRRTIFALAFIAVFVFVAGCQQNQPEVPVRVLAEPSGGMAPASEELASGPAEIILRMHGSNTIGSSLAPSLSKAYLQKLGAGAIEVKPGKVDEEKTVEAMLGGRHVGIEIFAHGSSTAFADMGNDATDIGMASRRVKPDEVTSLSALGNLRAPQSEHILGLDGIAVIVHRDNPLDKLSVEQIGQLFSGGVTNWNQVGGADVAVKVYSRDSVSGTFDTFKSLVLSPNNLAVVDSARFFEDSEKLADSVAADPGGIGFIGLPYIREAKAVSVYQDDSVPLLPNSFTVGTEDYLLSRRLFLYTPATSENKHVGDFVEFALSGEGQRIAAEEGFIPNVITPASPALAEDTPRRYAESVQGAQRLSVNFRFESGSNDLDNKAQRDLDRLVTYIERTKPTEVMLVGFTDSHGSLEKNMSLSYSRANGVGRLLRDKGISQLKIAGFGPYLPVASNGGEDGRAKNRRVEVWTR